MSWLNSLLGIKRQQVEIPELKGDVSISSSLLGGKKIRVKTSSSAYELSVSERGRTALPQRKQNDPAFKFKATVDGKEKTIFIKSSELTSKLGLTKRQLNQILDNSNDLQALIEIHDQVKTLSSTGDKTFALSIVLRARDLASQLKEDESFAPGETRQEQGFTAHKDLKGKIKIYYDARTILGKGSYKEVSKRINITKAKPSAYATVHTGKERHVRAAKKEFAIYQELKGIPQIAKFYFIVEQRVLGGRLQKREDSFGIMMKYYNKGDLGKFSEQLNPRQRGHAFLEILRGVKGMHEKGYVHRDLKPENILCHETSDAKGKKIFQFRIGDLGTATKVSDSDKFKSFLGSPLYSPPEAFDSTRFQGDGTKFDSWALGVMLHRLHYGEYPPFKREFDRGYQAWKKAKDDPNLKRRLAQAAAKASDFPYDAHDPVQNVIKNLLAADPSKRWSAEQALTALEEIPEGNLRIGKGPSSISKVKGKTAKEKSQPSPSKNVRQPRRENAQARNQRARARRQALRQRIKGK